MLASALSSIPPGRVTSFRILAQALGDVRAALAVKKECLSLSKLAPHIPWWRAVSSDGKPLPNALDRIREEGGLRDLEERKFYKDIVGWPIFRLMAEAQSTLSSKLRQEPLDYAEIAAGVDVSYGGREAVAACVSVDTSLKVVEVAYKRFIPQVPYVPTYLAFRELGGMLPSALRCSFDVVFVDGHGLSHPRLMGEASHLGLLLGRPSVGVAKSRLVGRLERGRLLIGDREVGAIVRKGYVSPGHLIDLSSAIRIAEKFWKNGKQPFPLILAHRYSKEAIRKS